MIVGIEGSIEHKEPTFIHVNTNGLIYEVFISLQSYSAITSERVKLQTSHIIRQDAQLLYGIIEKSEKVPFERLIKISGVGPKVGMAICSTFSASQFIIWLPPQSGCQVPVPATSSPHTLSRLSETWRSWYRHPAEKP